MNGRTYPVTALAVCLAAQGFATPSVKLRHASGTAQAKHESELVLMVRNQQGEPVGDIHPDELTITEKKETLVVHSVEPKLSNPLTVAVLIDHSGSRRDQLPNGEREAAKEFLRQVTSAGSIAVVASFYDEVYIHCETTRDPAALAAGIDAALLRPKWGGSSPYEAIMTVYDRRMASRPGMKVLVVVTDGDDNSSRDYWSRGNLTLKPTGRLVAKGLIKSLAGKNAAAFFLLLPSRNRSASNGRRDARKIADSTGGRAFELKEAGDFAAAFGQIQKEVEAFLTVRFSSAYNDCGVRPEVKSLRQGTRVVVHRPACRGI